MTTKRAIVDTLNRSHRMGRKGKDYTEEDKDRQRISDEIFDQLQYNSGLSEDQIEQLKSTLDNTLKQYAIQKDEQSEKTILDINLDVLEDFLAAKRVEGKSNNTIYNYGNEIAKMFQMMNKDYREIESDDIRHYMDFRKTHDNLSDVSIHNIRMYLLSFFKWLKIEEKIRKNPMDKIAVVKVERKVVDTLSEEEQEMIRCACKSERDIAIIDMLSGSGMRVSELVGLNKEDVNFDTGEVKVYGKGKKERMCYLTGKAKVHLRWYLDERVDDNPALFVTSKRPYTRLTKNGVEYALKEIAQRSRIPKIRLYPHKYRKTMATQMINKGADITAVQTLLGHKSVDTTRNCYVNISNESIKSVHHKYMG